MVGLAMYGLRFLIIDVLVCVCVGRNVQTADGDVCGKVPVDHGSVTSPNYPDSFPNTVSCTYQLMMRHEPHHGYMTVRFDDFSINLGSVAYNYVEVTNMDGDVLGNYTRAPPAGLTAKIRQNVLGPFMKIKFVATNNRHNLTGFSFYFEWRESRDIIGRTSLTGMTSGYVTSPGYPFNFPPNHEVQYTIQPPPDQDATIKFSFLDFDLGRLSNQTQLSVYVGSSPRGDPLYVFDGTKSLKRYYYTGSNKMTLLFSTARTNTARGFKLYFEQFCVYEGKDMLCDGAHMKELWKAALVIGTCVGGFILILTLSVILYYVIKRIKRAPKPNYDPI